MTVQTLPTPVDLRPIINRRSLFFVWGVVFLFCVVPTNVWAKMQKASHGPASIFVTASFASIAKTNSSQPKSPAETTEPSSTGNGLKESELSNEKNRRRAVRMAFYLVAVIVILGAGVLLGIVWWGFRVRRIARRHTAKRTITDPLWYLREGKPDTRKPDQQNANHDQLNDESKDSDSP